MISELAFSGTLTYRIKRGNKRKPSPAIKVGDGLWCDKQGNLYYG